MAPSLWGARRPRPISSAVTGGRFSPARWRSRRARSGSGWMTSGRASRPAASQHTPTTSRRAPRSRRRPSGPTIPQPPTPGPPSLSTPAEHQVLISWNAVSGAAAYNVYRSRGSCPGGPWVPVATGATGPPVTDSGLSGGTPYSYYVASTSDAAARCESAPSPCASVVPTGDCTLASRFGGITAATSPGTSDCAVVLSWNPAVPYCGSDVRYNVYRATDPGFTPGPANRIARCVMGTRWTDSADLSSGATYYYAVRAEDATTGHGGSCRGGNEDAHLPRPAAVPGR